MFVRPLRYIYLKTIRQNGSPNQISMGMAWGVCLGLITPPGPQMVIAFITSTIIGLNRITSVLGVWISNPFTFPIIYPAQVWLGSTICGLDINYKIPKNFQDFMILLKDKESHWDLLLSLGTGAFIFTIIITPISFYLTRFCVIRYRANKALRRAQTRQRYSVRLPQGNQAESETTG